MRTDDLQRRMPCDQIEVPVAVQDRHVMVNSDGGNHAVSHPAWRFAECPTSSVDACRGLVVEEGPCREGSGSFYEASQRVAVSLISRSSENLHSDDVGDGDRLLVVDERTESAVGGAPGGAEVLDPG